MRRLLILAALAALAACKTRPPAPATGDPAARSDERLCAGGTRDVRGLLERLNETHKARAEEVRAHIRRTTERELVSTNGAKQVVTLLPRYPECTASTDAVLHDRC